MTIHKIGNGCYFPIDKWDNAEKVQEHPQRKTSILQDL